MKSRFDLCFPPLEFDEWNVGAWVLMSLHGRVLHEGFPGFVGDGCSVAWIRGVRVFDEVVLVRSVMSFG